MIALIFIWLCKSFHKIEKCTQRNERSKKSFKIVGSRGLWKYHVQKWKQSMVILSRNFNRTSSPLNYHQKIKEMTGLTNQLKSLKPSCFWLKLMYRKWILFMAQMGDRRPIFFSKCLRFSRKISSNDFWKLAFSIPNNHDEFNKYATDKCACSFR